MWVREREEMGLAIYYVQCWLKADKEWLCLAGCVVWMCVYICQYLIIMFGKNLKLKHSLAAVIWPVIELQVIGFVLNSSEINATPTPLPVELCLLAKISNLIQNRPFSLSNLLNNVVTGPIQDCGRALCWKYCHRGAGFVYFVISFSKDIFHSGLCCNSHKQYVIVVFHSPQCTNTFWNVCKSTAIKDNKI